MSEHAIKHTELPVLEASTLNYSHVVGHEVILYSDQMPATPILTKVSSHASNRLSIESSGRYRDTELLVNRQMVIVQFPYKGQDISIEAKLIRSDGGRCFLELSEAATPLKRRRFFRIPIRASVRLAALPLVNRRRKSIAQLRWLETGVVNFSSGGLLTEIPSKLDPGVLLLVNFDLPNYEFPKLVVAEVRYCLQNDKLKFRAGMGFVVKEEIIDVVPEQLRSMIPAIALAYTQSEREKLNKSILENS